MTVLHLDDCPVLEQEHYYCVRRIAWHDSIRKRAYQVLRAETFVKRLGWNIPLTPDGREYDRYDQRTDEAIHIHGVYGRSSRETEYLLGGVRIFHLHSWDDSMVVNEFYDAGMIPGDVLQHLKDHYHPTEYLELTRLCLQHGRWYVPSELQDTAFAGFRCDVARDLIYASAYMQAEQTNRRSALALVDAGYLRVMKRSHFIFRQLYAQHIEKRQGYALMIIDLAATIRALRRAGANERAGRMMVLCQNKAWVND